MSEQFEVVEAGSFCWNEACPRYAQVNAGNLRRFGRTAKGTQRLQCRTCEKVFAVTRGTPFHGVHDPEKMLLALSMLCERSSIRGVARTLKVKRDTVGEWLEKAGQHVAIIEYLLQKHHQVTRAQLDGLWAFVGHKGEKGGTRKRKSEAPSGARG